MEHSIPIEEAERQFTDLLHRAEHQGESTILTRSGVPVACMVPFKQLRTGQELAELLERRPHLLPGQKGGQTSITSLFNQAKHQFDCEPPQSLVI